MGRVPGRARDFLLPVVFPLVMAVGGVLGILGVPLPGVEIGIAVSAVVLGMMVALAARPPLWVAASSSACSRSSTATPTAPNCRPAPTRVAYSAGFVIATGVLHLCGIAFGLLARWPAGRIAVRAAGGAIAIAGVDVSRAARYDGASSTGLLHPLLVPSHSWRSRRWLC